MKANIIGGLAALTLIPLGVHQGVKHYSNSSQQDSVAPQAQEADEQFPNRALEGPLHSTNEDLRDVVAEYTGISELALNAQNYSDAEFGGVWNKNWNTPAFYAHDAEWGHKDDWNLISYDIKFVPIDKSIVADEKVFFISKGDVVYFNLAQTTFDPTTTANWKQAENFELFDNGRKAKKDIVWDQLEYALGTDHPLVVGQAYDKMSKALGTQVMEDKPQYALNSFRIQRKWPSYYGEKAESLKVPDIRSTR